MDGNICHESTSFVLYEDEMNFEELYQLEKILVEKHIILRLLSALNVVICGI